MKTVGQFVLFLIVVAGFSACGNKNNDQFAEETRTIGKHKVKIRAARYVVQGMVEGHATGEGKMIAFDITVDDRPPIEHVGYVTPLVAATPKTALSRLKLDFSKSGEHFIATVEKHREFVHMLPQGRPFKIDFKRGTTDPWRPKSADQLPSMRIMLDSLVNGNRESDLEKKSKNELESVLSMQKPGGPTDVILAKALCHSDLAKMVIVPTRISDCADNPAWRSEMKDFCLANKETVLKCPESYYKLVATAGDDALFATYDPLWTGAYAGFFYVRCRLDAGAEIQFYDRVLTNYTKAIDPFVNTGFSNENQIPHAVFNMLDIIKDRTFRKKIRFCVMKTRNFELIAGHLRDIHRIFPEEARKDLLEAAIRSFNANPRKSRETWNYIVFAASCDRIRKVLEKLPEGKFGYALPDHCKY